MKKNVFGAPWSSGVVDHFIALSWTHGFGGTRPFRSGAVQVRGGSGPGRASVVTRAQAFAVAKVVPTGRARLRDSPGSWGRPAVLPIFSQASFVRGSCSGSFGAILRWKAALSGDRSPWDYPRPARCGTIPPCAKSCLGRRTRRYGVPMERCARWSRSLSASGWAAEQVLAGTGAVPAQLHCPRDERG